MEGTKTAVVRSRHKLAPVSIGFVSPAELRTGSIVNELLLGNYIGSYERGVAERERRFRFGCPRVLPSRSGRFKAGDPAPFIPPISTSNTNSDPEFLMLESNFTMNHHAS